ncbi:unnamed protein product, partial [Cuscuta epithymum]
MEESGFLPDLSWKRLSPPAAVYRLELTVPLEFAEYGRRSPRRPRFRCTADGPPPPPAGEFTVPRDSPGAAPGNSQVRLNQSPRTQWFLTICRGGVVLRGDGGERKSDPDSHSSAADALLLRRSWLASLLPLQRHRLTPTLSPSQLNLQPDVDTSDVWPGVGEPLLQPAFQRIWGTAHRPDALVLSRPRPRDKGQAVESQFSFNY